MARGDSRSLDEEFFSRYGAGNDNIIISSIAGYLRYYFTEFNGPSQRGRVLKSRYTPAVRNLIPYLITLI